jgi:hypothetical protein
MRASVAGYTKFGLKKRGVAAPNFSRMLLDMGYYWGTQT